jgi:hypothetical protein
MPPFMSLARYDKCNESQFNYFCIKLLVAKRQFGRIIGAPCVIATPRLSAQVLGSASIDFNKLKSGEG